MAKKQSSAEKYKALVGVQFTQVEEGVKKLQKQMAPVGITLQKGMVKAFDKSFQQIDRLKAELEAATDEETFRGLEQSMGVVLDRTIKVGREISKIQSKKGQIVNVGATNQQVASLNRLRDSLKQVNVAQQRTVMSSQNMLRVIQDSPFGMLGMANNFQMLGEDISRGMAKGTKALDTLKAGLKGLIMGPMAFAAVIAIGTIVIQKWDKIVEAGVRLKEALKGISKEQRELNSLMREFEGAERYEAFLQMITASDEDLETARANREVLLATFGSGEFEIKRRKEVNAQLKILYGADFTANLLSDQKMLEAEKVVLTARIDARQRAADELHKINLVIKEKELIELQFLGHEVISPKAQKILDDLEKARLKREAAAKKEALAQLKLLSDRDKMGREFIQLRLKAEREADAERLEDAEKAAVKEAKARHDAFTTESRRLRREAQAVQRTVRAGVTAAGAIGAGVIPSVISIAGQEEQMEVIKMNTFWEKVRIDEKISVVREGISDMDFLMANAQGKELAVLQSQKEQLLAEEKKYLGDVLIETEKSEFELAKLKEKFRQEDLQSLSALSGSMGGIFGDMASIFAKETEKGLKQHRGMLKMAAFADAIAASISVFRGMVAANPLSVAAAFAASAAILVSLVAKIKQIDNPSGPSGGAGGPPTGGFIALNQNVAANRAAGFGQDQSRLNAIGSATASRQADANTVALQELGDKIGTQKVVIDKQTATDLKRLGEDGNTRKVQTTA